MGAELRSKLTRTLWYTLGTAHDFESKRLQSARSFFISVFTHHQHLYHVFGIWSAIPLIQIAWQGDYEQWVSNPRGHLGTSLGLRTSSQCLVAASFLVLLSGLVSDIGHLVHVPDLDAFDLGGHLGSRYLERCLRSWVT